MSAHKILIVEDDPDIRQALAEALEEADYRVHTAVNGSEALTLLRESRAQYCMPYCTIVLDLMMPVMDGRQFLREQRGDPLLAQIPVVVLSAYLRDQPVEGVTSLPKPISLLPLLRTLESHCSTPHAAC